MASELNHHVGYSRENECWFVRFYPYQTEQQAIEAIAEFTRPTPVVPVSPDATGKCGELVTVKPLEWRRYRNGDAEAVTPFGEIYTAYVNGYWRITRNGKAGKFIKASGGDDVDAAKAGAQADFDANVLRLVRSQAVELLAAERAEKEKAQASRLYWKGKHQKLEADNAALTARVKAETELREDHQQRNKELEAKLAAAEKDAATWEANFKALNEKYARAALGGKP